MNIKNNEFIAYSYIYYKYLKYKKKLELKQFCVYNIIVLTDLPECKTEKRNSQFEHGQPMEPTIGLFCTCDSGVACSQSQHKCNFWRMSSMFEAYCTGKSAWQLSIKLL